MTAPTTDAPVRRPGRPPNPVPPDGAEITAALIRVVQAVTNGMAVLIGRADLSPNATLVKFGAAREDVEMLRAFLAARPRPAHLPDPEV